MEPADSGSIVRAASGGGGGRASIVVAGGLLTMAGLLVCAGLFASGFLLMRTELPQRSVCREAFVKYGSGGGGGRGGSCWLPERRFERLVLLVVDALRFDFIRPNQSLAGRIWANNIAALDELQRSRPRHVFLAHAEADAPTTTLQRLKALLTGTLPTFIDASANFGGAEITEDNLIDQLVARNRSVVFMGDDTWVGLLPRRFLRAYPFPSFNVHDLETVDRGVDRHLVEELQRNDWDVLVAHTLGVDHCGHRYGPDHPEMRRKLREVDRLLRSLTRQLDNRTLLVVLGDHGMTPTGDHGGATGHEVDSGLALVSNSRPLLAPEAALHLLREPPRLSQIDLLPTLALLLGVPIPYSSLGAVPPELFPGQLARDALTVNARQVVRFLDAYQAAYGDLPPDRLARLRAAANSTVAGLRELLDEAKDACRDVWARFDEPAIRLALLTGAVCLAFGAAFCLQGEDGSGNGGLLLGFAASLALLALARLGHSVGLLPPTLADFILPCAALSAGIACLASRLLRVSAAGGKTGLDTGSRLSRASGLASCLALSVASLGHLSNSYIIAEPACLLFLLQTLLLLQAGATCVAALLRAHAVPAASSSRRKPAFNSVSAASLMEHPCTLTLCLHAGAALCLRLAARMVSCREEARTAGWCHPADDWPASAAAAVASGHSGQLLVCVLALLAGLAAFRWWLRRLGCLNGHSFAVLALSYLPVLAGFCAVLHWTLQASSSLPGGASVTSLPRLGLALAGLGCLALLLAPASVHLERRLTSVERRRAAVAAALARSADLSEMVSVVVADMFSGRSKEEGGDTAEADEDQRPLAYGLTTVYRTAHCGLLLFACLAVLLLAGHRALPAMLLCGGAALARAELRAAELRLGPGRGLSGLSAWPDLLFLQLLGWAAFYACGLQPALSAIRWDPAFIFYDAETSGPAGRALAGLLIIAGMFCCQLLSGLATPLLQLLLPLTAGRLPFALSREKWRRYLSGNPSGDFLLAELPSGSLACAAAAALARQLLLAACLTLGCMLAAAWHKRHLMAWKVFAPRMMFGVVGCGATAAGAGLALICAACVDRGIRRWAVRKLGLKLE